MTVALDLIVLTLPDEFFPPPPPNKFEAVESFPSIGPEKILPPVNEKNSFTEYCNERVEFFNSWAGIIVLAVSVFSILVTMEICGIYPYGS